MSDTKNLLRQMNDAPDMSDEDASALQASFLEEHGLAEGDQSAKVNAAARLLMTGKHQEAVVAYTAIAEEYPEERGTCESQIGAAYYFLKDYEKALSFYESARENGADAEMMQDNIDEAKEAIEKLARGEDPDEGGAPLGLIVLVLVALAAGAYFLL